VKVMACTLACGAILLSACAPRSAALPSEVTSLGAVTTANSERYRFESRSIGAFQIDVVNTGTAAAEKSLPVVFVTDADPLTTLVPAVANWGGGAIPPMIVVGIGYGGGDVNDREGFLNAVTRRPADFMPEFDQAYTDDLIRFLDLPGDTRLGGGADKFLAFVDNELKPFIASRYPQANIEDTALVGVSLGGLFTMHVFFTSPGSFDRYIAISPAVDVNTDRIFREESELGDVNARLFVGMAEHDVPTTVAALPRLYARMAAHRRPGLRSTFQVFPGETHQSVMPVAILPALRAVFDPPPGDPVNDTFMEKSRKDAEALARKLDGAG